VTLVTPTEAPSLACCLGGGYGESSADFLQLPKRAGSYCMTGPARTMFGAGSTVTRPAVRNKGSCSTRGMF
jgi:hypothetical protein